MARVFANVADDELDTGISAGATSSTLVDASEFPATGDFSIRFEDASDPTVFEIVTATARSGNVLTHGATVSAWDAGDKVLHVLAKADLDEFLQETAAAATYQALSGKGVASGYAGLGTDGKVADGQGRVQDLLDWQYVRKTANEDVTSSTTLQDDDHLTYAIGANETWLLRITLFVTAGSATPDINLTVTGPSGAAGSWGMLSSASYLTSPADVLGNAEALGLAAATSFVQVLAICRNGATPGNLRLQWAQNTSDANFTRVLADSFAIFERVA